MSKKLGLGIGVIAAAVVLVCSPLVASASFTIHDSATATDNTTDLMWQREDDNTSRTWENALAYCQNLTLGGHSDWRLPTRRELVSIVDYSVSSPSIDSTVFPGTNSSVYWSSSTDAYSTYNAWSVYFNGGVVYGNSKGDDFYVRCVR